MAVVSVLEAVAHRHRHRRLHGVSPRDAARHDLESRQIAPLREKVDAILGDVKADGPGQLGSGEG